MTRHNTAVILAGGRSTRMGRPKAALPFGGATIIARLVTELIDEFDELIVVAAPREHDFSAVEELIRPWRTRVLVVRDEAPFEGPAPALVRGLRASRLPTVFVCSCDLPLLTARVGQTLCEMVGRFDAAIPVINGLPQALCAGYQRRSIDEIDASVRAGERRLTAIVQRLNWRQIDEAELRRYDPNFHSFFNINSPDDYERALALAGYG